MFATTKYLQPKCFLFVCVLLIIFFITLESSAELAPTNQTKDNPSNLSLGEKLEDLGLIYKNEESEIIQEAWLLGRYHGQYHWSEGSAGEDDGFETRRLRMGGQAKIFKTFLIHAQMVSGSDVNPFYNGFTELWAQWAFSPEVALSVGQQKNRFTHDRNVSSRYLNYLERSMLTNMFAADYTPAVTLQGKVKDITYYTGMFSNATSKNIDNALTEFDSGYSLLSAGYYNLGHSLGTDSSYLYASYVHSDANEKATNLNHFNNGVSSALILTEGSGAIVTEITSGIGSDKGNAVGINLQPSYFLTNKIQLATRYQLTSSNNEHGLRAQRRYEREAGLQTGNLYQAGYLGLNYYIAKHRLKLMGGIEYSTLGGEELWTTSTMIRFYFGPHSGGAFPMNQMLKGHFFEFD